MNDGFAKTPCIFIVNAAKKLETTKMYSVIQPSNEIKNLKGYKHLMLMDFEIINDKVNEIIGDPIDLELYKRNNRVNLDGNTSIPFKYLEGIQPKIEPSSTIEPEEQKRTSNQRNNINRNDNGNRNEKSNDEKRERFNEIRSNERFNRNDSGNKNEKSNDEKRERFNEINVRSNERFNRNDSGNKNEKSNDEKRGKFNEINGRSNERFDEGIEEKIENIEEEDYNLGQYKMQRQNLQEKTANKQEKVLNTNEKMLKPNPNIGLAIESNRKSFFEKFKVILNCETLNNNFIF